MFSILHLDRYKVPADGHTCYNGWRSSGRLRRFGTFYLNKMAPCDPQKYLATYLKHDSPSYVACRRENNDV